MPLRIGEWYELRRRDCVNGPKGGIWISVRGTLATPGRTWTDSGDGTERRGTKAKGPDGDLRGRRTYLLQFCVLPAEAELVVAAGIRGFVLTSTGDLSTWDTLSLLARQWDALEHGGGAHASQRRAI